MKTKSSHILSDKALTAKKVLTHIMNDFDAVKKISSASETTHERNKKLDGYIFAVFEKNYFKKLY